MNQDWKTFLVEEAGAVLEAGRVMDFGNAARELQVAASGNVFADLSHFGAISVSGADAAAFLQGQLTNDVKGLPQYGYQLNGYCTPKGRLLAVVHTLRADDRYILVLPGDLIQPILERLRKFVLMSKVTLEDERDRLVHIGVSGAAIPEELDALQLPAPDPDAPAAARGEILVWRRPGRHPRFEILGPEGEIKRIWQRLDVRAAPVGAAAWEMLEIENGIPVVTAQTSEMFIPQSMNLERIGAISFKKGCYTGQEVVARLHYRGTVKRRMYIARIATDRIPEPGTPVYAEGDTEQAAGAVALASTAVEGGCVALVVLQLQFLDSPLHLKDREGTTLMVAAPPYSLE